MLDSRHAVMIDFRSREEPRWHSGIGLASFGASRVLVALTLCALVACGRGQEEPNPSAAAADGSPNILLVSIDTLRADALSPYGGPFETRAFESLASDGVVFEQALAPASSTAPSHAALLSGRDPRRYGILSNGLELPPSYGGLAQRLRRAGYGTAAFVSSFVLDARFGWQRGFDLYDSEFSEEGATFDKDAGRPSALRRLLGGGFFWHQHEFEGFDRRAGSTTDAASGWLRGAAGPWFLFVHYFDPHSPYLPPREWAERVADYEPDLSGRATAEVPPGHLARLIRAYYGEVLYTDAELARLLAAARTASGERELWIVVTADHGEGLGEHGCRAHALNLHSELLRVPLLIASSQRKLGGRRVQREVGLIDIAPTVAALAGVPSEPGEDDGFDGRSLVPAILNGDEPALRTYFAYRRPLQGQSPALRAPWAAVRQANWKLVRIGDDPANPDRLMLFDHSRDPGELHDRASEEPARSQVLRNSLDRHEATLAGAPEPLPVDEKTREALKVLGYEP